MVYSDEAELLLECKAFLANEKELVILQSLLPTRTLFQTLKQKLNLRRNQIFSVLSARPQGRDLIQYRLHLVSVLDHTA